MGWPVKFAVRGLWVGGLTFALGAGLYMYARPTSFQRASGFVLMFAAVPVVLLVFVISTWRRAAAKRRQARTARRTVPSFAGHAPTAARRPTRGAGPARPIRRPVVARGP